VATLAERYWQELRPSAAAWPDVAQAPVWERGRRQRRRQRRQLPRRARDGLRR
jgi:hypothetical protein